MGQVRETLQGALVLLALSVTLGVTCNSLRHAPVALLPHRQSCPGTLTLTQARDLHTVRGAVFVDVRPQEQYLEGHVEDALHMPVASLESQLDTLRSANVLIVYGESAPEAARALCGARFGTVLLLSGGLEQWRSAGGAVRSGALP